MREPQPERRKTDRRLKKFMIETRILYAVVILFAVMLGALYEDLRQQRRQRGLDQAITAKTICERQEFVLAKIVDTKDHLQSTNKNVSTGNQALKQLVKGVAKIAREEVQPALRTAEQRLDKVLASTRKDNDELRMGKAAIGLEMARVDCDNLPAINPFEGNPKVQRTTSSVRQR